VTIDARPAEPKVASGDEAARATTRLVIAYLVLTMPVLLLGIGSVRLAGAVAALHLGLVMGVAELHRRRARGAVGTTRVLADWLPLVLVPALYAELPILMESLPGALRYHDPAIAALENGLFGGQPAFEWAGAWPVTALSELLHACYVSYYPLIFVPPLLLYLGARGTRESGPERMAAFHETVFALALCFLVCFSIFVVFPVQGPRYLGVPEGVPDGPVRRLVLAILERGSSRGAAFPSSHVAVAVTQALLALRHQPRVGRCVAAIAVGLGAGAVYGGFHYGVDALAGAALGAAVVPLASWTRRGLGSGVKGA
jgi:membrane-associated phospholipid phosphatase